MPPRFHSGRRRAANQCARIGEEVRLSAASFGLSVHQLAERSGLSWATVRRVVDGEASVSVVVLAAVAEAAGLDLVLRAYPGRSPSLRDSGQLGLAEQLCRLAHPSWQPALEYGIGPHRESIDLVLLAPSEIVASEIERVAVDWQGQYRRADAKRRALAAHHRRPVRLLMIVEDTRRNRASLEPHLALIRSSLPAGSREILAALRVGQPLGRDGLLWLRRPPRSPDRR
jgi:transcriptional regulator with XRE-family HTH domain